MMRELQKTLKDAYQAGGIELYLSTLRVGPLPLSSSLLVSFPMPGTMPASRDVHTLAEVLGRRRAEATVVQLSAAGGAVREFRSEQLIRKPSSATSSPRQPSSSTFLSRRPKSG
jgi:hypothetical protein